MSIAFGSHVSIAGGVFNSIERAREIGCDSFQVFVKPNRQWRLPKITQEEANLFCKEAEKFLIYPVAHSSYLLNLASSNQTVLDKSIETLIAELDACDLLKIKNLVLHPGSHGGDGEEVGLKRIKDSLFSVFKRFKGNCNICLELTAGTGFNLGYKFEHISWLIDNGPSDKLTVCLDTAHIFGAGYDISDKKKYKKIESSFKQMIGWDKLKCLHLNDSKCELASRKDRHEHIGQGFIGLEGFKNILSTCSNLNIPGIIETPKGKAGNDDQRNLEILRDICWKS